MSQDKISTAEYLLPDGVLDNRQKRNKRTFDIMDKKFDKSRVYNYGSLTYSLADFDDDILFDDKIFQPDLPLFTQFKAFPQFLAINSRMPAKNFKCAFNLDEFGMVSVAYQFIKTAEPSHEDLHITLTYPHNLLNVHQVRELLRYVVREPHSNIVALLTTDSDYFNYIKTIFVCLVSNTLNLDQDDDYPECYDAHHCIFFSEFTPSSEFKGMFYHVIDDNAEPKPAVPSTAIIEGNGEDEIALTIEDA